MTRYRWLKAQWPLTMKALGKRLKSKPFGPEMNHGFVIDRIREDYIDGRYIERIEYTETVVDPFGSELTFDRVEFRQTEFRAAVLGPGLELRNPPRSIQPLMNRLSEAADFEVSITTQVVDVLAWSTEFQRASCVSLIVDSLQMGSLELEPGVAAKVVIKGERDVRDACTSLAGDRKFTLEKIQLRLEAPYAGSILLTNTGSVSLAVNDPNDEILSALRTGIPGFA